MPMTMHATCKELSNSSIIWEALLSRFILTDFMHVKCSLSPMDHIFKQ